MTDDESRASRRLPGTPDDEEEGGGTLLARAVATSPQAGTQHPMNFLPREVLISVLSFVGPDFFAFADFVDLLQSNKRRMNGRMNRFRKEEEELQFLSIDSAHFDEFYSYSDEEDDGAAFRASKARTKHEFISECFYMLIKANTERRKARQYRFETLVAVYRGKADRKSEEKMAKIHEAQSHKDQEDAGAELEALQDLAKILGNGKLSETYRLLCEGFHDLNWEYDWRQWESYQHLVKEKTKYAARSQWKYYNRRLEALHNEEMAMYDAALAAEKKAAAKELEEVTARLVPLLKTWKKSKKANPVEQASVHTSAANRGSIHNGASKTATSNAPPKPAPPKQAAANKQGGSSTPKVVGLVQQFEAMATRNSSTTPTPRND